LRNKVELLYIYDDDDDEEKKDAEAPIEVVKEPVAHITESTSSIVLKEIV